MASYVPWGKLGHRGRRWPCSLCDLHSFPPVSGRLAACLPEQPWAATRNSCPRAFFPPEVTGADTVKGAQQVCGELLWLPGSSSHPNRGQRLNLSEPQLSHLWGRETEDCEEHGTVKQVYPVRVLTASFVPGPPELGARDTGDQGDKTDKPAGVDWPADTASWAVAGAQEAQWGIKAGDEITGKT